MRMFKDIIDQMKDDEYIDKLHKQINGLKSDIEMVDQQNLSIMKTAEKHKRKAEKLEQQNKRYRDCLNDIIKMWTESTDATDDTWLSHEMSETARKALEGEK